MPLIELDHVSMTFRVREQHQITLKEYLLKGMFRRSANPLLKIRALQDISLRFEDGDRVAVLGGNGAGKSTLLRLLAGVYTPTRGRRTVEGRISSLFELGLGFEMEATGRQNIFYRGYLQGETPRSIGAKMAEIAEFSELGRFLDIPMRYYSAGMMVRLAFSIATTVRPEILLVDEVLSAGDMAFQAKARQRMREVMSRARMVVIVSHDLKTLARVCDTGIWLDRGRVRMSGPVVDVVNAYEEYVQGPSPVPPAGPSKTDSERPGLNAPEPLCTVADGRKPSPTGFPQLESWTAGEDR
jgi:ABC-type polysaccharide/polyol phosphate transport system ATPase subunit